MTNKEVAQMLRNVAASYIIKDERKFRFQIMAYQRAADTIEHQPSEIRELYKENKLDMVPGVGASIKSHLEELFKTGKVKHFDWVTKGVPKSLFPLLDIPTFGPKKAYRLVTEFGLKDPETVIVDVERLAISGKIAALPGFGEKSEKDIIRAISEFRQKKGKAQRMVLPYAFDLAEKVVNYVKQSETVVEAYPLGSLRRMTATVGDIDIAVATKNPAAVIKHFIAYPYKDRVIEEGSTTASILVSSGRQVDLMTQPPESFGSLLQHFTGSKNHNIHLRDFALKKGISLSEYGIKKQVRGKQITEKYNSEEKFYNAIGMDWIPPELREDTGEIELAIQHKLPDLIQISDIKGDLHIHSDYPIEPSHDLGHDSMESLLEKARKLNYEYLGFSEHNPSVSKHTENSVYSILEKRKERIDQIKSSTKDVRVLNLLEVDILASGELSLNNKALSTLDGAIVSVHSSFGMDSKKMTKRIIKGLSNPKARIFGHPTGRLLNQRPSIDFDYDEILDFCKKRSIALEINAWPSRLDLPDIMVKQAIQNGVKLIINTDSHAVWQMNLMKFGVAVAKRGWATKDDILNTLPYNKFIEWLRK